MEHRVEVTRPPSFIRATSAPCAKLLCGVHRVSACVLLPLVVGLACNSPSQVDNSGACQQTFEFGNSGCVELSGEVVNAVGRPLRNIGVAAHAISGDVGLTGIGLVTDSTGQFRFRLMRMFVLRQPSMLRDTVSIYVVASDIGSASSDGTARIRDSVIATPTFAPVGDVPVATHVRVVLASP